MPGYSILLMRFGSQCGVGQEARCQGFCTCMQAKEEVSATLTDLGVEHAVDMQTEGGGLDVPIALAAQGSNMGLALLPCPAHQFSANEPHRPLGAALLHWSLLEARGWQVLAIPLHHWLAQASTTLKRAYLMGRLGAPKRLPLPSIATSSSTSDPARSGGVTPPDSGEQPVSVASLLGSVSDPGLGSPSNHSAASALLDLGDATTANGLSSMRHTSSGTSHSDTVRSSTAAPAEVAPPQSCSNWSGLDSTVQTPKHSMSWPGSGLLISALPTT